MNHEIINFRHELVMICQPFLVDQCISLDKDTSPHPLSRILTPHLLLMHIVFHEKLELKKTNELLIELKCNFNIFRNKLKKILQK